MKITHDWKLADAPIHNVLCTPMFLYRCTRCGCQELRTVTQDVRIPVMYETIGPDEQAWVIDCGYHHSLYRNRYRATCVTDGA